MESKYITCEEFMSEENWRDNVQYLTALLQSGLIQLSTLLEILKHVEDGKV